MTPKPIDHKLTPTETKAVYDNVGCLKARAKRARKVSNEIAEMAAALKSQRG